MAGTVKEDIGREPHVNAMDIVQTDLWIGGASAANDLKTLQDKKVNCILTVDTYPLPTNIYDQKHLVIKYIKANDTPTEDLLSHFEDAYSFIESGLDKGVLVHCFFGVSRSSTIVISYLMKKNKWSMKRAHDFVKSKRPSICPNPGFLDQLKLYENMGNQVNRNNVQYKMFRLYIAAHARKHNIIPNYLNDVIKNIALDAVTDSKVFKCKKCRTIIAFGSNIIPHAPSEEYSWRDDKWSEDFCENNICKKSYFIEPLSWMENVAQTLQGKLLCPKEHCKQKLGSFSWSNGSDCPCGTKVCPAFYLIPSKVDTFILPC